MVVVVVVLFAAVLPGVRLVSSGSATGGEEGWEPDRSLEVMATAAVKAVCDHLDTLSCCQMTTQKSPAANTIHQIWKSRLRLIDQFSREDGGSTSSTLLIVLVDLVTGPLPGINRAEIL